MSSGGVWTYYEMQRERDGVKASVTGLPETGTVVCRGGPTGQTGEGPRQPRAAARGGSELPREQRETLGGAEGGRTAPH